VNKGQKIYLRLRYPGDQNQFLPQEQVVDTMLHELSHNVHGPHDDKFNALWNQLREEYEGLVRKGYTGEGFLSQGRQLGGKRIPRHEAQRIARIAAEKRRNLSAGSGQRLGGAPVPVGRDIRNVILDAIENRSSITRGCGSGNNRSEKEVKAITDKASHNGFRTKAEEDEANDQAIAQALWELVQEEEKEKYGESYVPPSAENPWGNGYMSVKDNPRSVRNPSSVATDGFAASTSALARTSQARPISRSVSKNPTTANSSKSTASANQQPAVSEPQDFWACQICTCHNPITFLCCDACTTERPADIKVVRAPIARPNNTTKRQMSKPDTWICHNCGTEMSHDWWTCSTCSTMKLSS
jgi:DNA-dependent metalloprotease WSS1